MGEAHQRGTSRRQLFSCGVGSFCNDLISKVVMSFGLVFYTKVANLSNKQAGLVLVVGQVTTFLGNCLFGYCCDHVHVPLLSRAYGMRKTWHSIGTIFTVPFLVLSFSHCLLCPQKPSENSWFRTGYFSVTYGLACFWYGAVSVAHLSFIPEISQTQDELVIINSIRTVFSYLGGICTYGVAWIILGQKSDGNLSKDDSMEFTKISISVCAIGLLFVVIFHIGTPKMRKDERSRRKSSILHTTGVHSMSVVYCLERKGEEVPKEDSIGKKKSSVMSVVRKVSTAIIPFEFQDCYEDMDELRVQHTTKIRGSIDQDMGNDSQITNETNTPVEDSDIRSKQQAIPVANNVAYGQVLRAHGTDGRVCEQDTNNAPRDKIDYATHAKCAKDWLKDPKFYKVAIIYGCSFSTVSLTFAYLALYLMDHLHFEKEATAYFSLVFLVSGVFGSAVSKQVKKVIGRRFTFCCVAGLASVTATWFYFVTESTKHMVYAPIVLFGCCVSVLNVMALSYVGYLVGENKETAGFVFSFANATQNVTTGLPLMLIQSFYPSVSDGCQDCGDYVRVVFPLAVGFLPLTGLLVVLFSEFATSSCCAKNNVQLSESIAEVGGVLSPSGTTEDTAWNTRL